MDIFEATGSPVKPLSPLKGQNQVISSAVMKEIQQLYKSDLETYLNEIQFWLAMQHDIAISIPALHRNLMDTGLTNKLLTKIAEEHDQQA
jgi:hypothetical protein